MNARGRAHVGRGHAAAIEAVRRIESARLIGGLVRVVHDIGLAEDLAQEALERWLTAGVPASPGAWFCATAKNRGIDELRLEACMQRFLTGQETLRV